MLGIITNCAYRSNCTSEAVRNAVKTHIHVGVDDDGNRTSDIRVSLDPVDIDVVNR
jgi:hypothetical protein